EVVDAEAEQADGAGLKRRAARENGVLRRGRLTRGHGSSPWWAVGGITGQGYPGGSGRGQQFTPHEGGTLIPRRSASGPPRPFPSATFLAPRLPAPSGRPWLPRCRWFPVRPRPARREAVRPRRWRCCRSGSAPGLSPAVAAPRGRVAARAPAAGKVSPL